MKIFMPAISCIYGVDLNEMAVELSKLSLWLDSFTLGAPLSFLDHHLKCGNSLVGTDLETLEKAQEGQLFTVNLEPLQRAIRDMIFVSSLSDATYEQVKDSADKYHDADSHIEGYRILLDILVSEHFGIKDARAFLLDRGTKIDLNNIGKSIESMSKKDRETIETIEKIADEKRFFHWEIEFPEVFYERVGDLKQKVEKKGNPGFDCVIGNPPYDVVAEKEQGYDVSFEKEFFKSTSVYEHVVSGKLNLFRLFSMLSLHLLRKNGFHGFIVPMSLMADAQAYHLRKFLLEKNEIIQIEAFPQKDDPLDRVFFNAKLSTCIYIVNKVNLAKPFIIRIHPGKEILESSLPLKLSWENIKALDPENLSFPSNPKIKVDDIQLAAKLVDVSDGVKLGDYAPSQQGEVNLTAQIEVLSDKRIGPEVLRGAHVNRYKFHDKPKQGVPKYLNVAQYLAAKRPTSKAFDHKKIRIGYQRGSAIDNWRRIIATIIEPDNFCSDTINYIVEPKKLSIYAVLGLLNSKVLEWRFSFTSTNNHVNSYEINSLPIPRISFTTPEDERKDRVAEGIGLYKKCMLALESQGVQNDKAAEKNDRSVPDPHAGGEEESLSGEHTGASGNVHGLRGRAGEPEDAERISKDSDKILNWVDGELAENCNDTIHDFLAHLAEQMIEMNKKKNAEIKDFLGFLSRRIDKEIDDLKNKTKIKSYQSSDFGTLIKILEQNKIKLSFNDEKRLEEAYNQSLGNILPVMAQINATDSLIDQLVYKLYELTKEEVRVVES